MTESEILDAAYHTWGLVPQMLMVGEEANELTKTIFKWRRARVKVLKHKNTKVIPKDFDQANYELVLTALERSFKKAEERVVDEAMDVRLMLRQLEVMLPADYVALYEKKLQACAQKLRNAGVQI